MLNRIQNRNWQSSLALGAIALSSALIANPAYASPNVWWDHHFSDTLSQADCVNKAMDIFMTEKAGRIAKEEDGVRAWNETTLGVVECLKVGDKLTIMVLVTSHDVKAGSRLYHTLDEAMKASAAGKP